MNINDYKLKYHWSDYVLDQTLPCFFFFFFFCTILAIGVSFFILLPCKYIRDLFKFSEFSDLCNLQFNREMRGPLYDYESPTGC